MSQPRATDWDRYYHRPFCAAGLTRCHTGRVLLQAIREHTPGQRPGDLVVAELGGADSCFYSPIMRELRPAQYHVIDQYQPGLERLRARQVPGGQTVFHQGDILEADLPLKADVVFSVGLIEHFSPEDTVRAIRAHFRLASPQGVVIMSFPTPTWLYRTARRLSEALGQWIFHDERPLSIGEVREAVEEVGRVAQVRMIWAIIFTQALVVAHPWPDRLAA